MAYYNIPLPLGLPARAPASDDEAASASIARPAATGGATPSPAPSRPRTFAAGREPRGVGALLDQVREVALVHDMLHPDLGRAQLAVPDPSTDVSGFRSALDAEELPEVGPGLPSPTGRRPQEPPSFWIDPLTVTTRASSVVT